MNIPSYAVTVEDVIAIRDRSKKQLRIQAALELSATRAPVEWMAVDADKMEGVFTRTPDRGELPSEINENLIVELYSK